MKVFLGIILVCLSTLFAYILAEKYSFRKQFYNDFCNFNRIFKQEIAFRQRSLMELVKENKSTDFYCALKTYVEKYEFDFNKNYLKKDEIDYFYNYLNSIGTGDKDSQIDFLSNVEKIVQEKQKTCENDEKKYKSLYIKLGFLVGLILFVLII